MDRKGLLQRSVAWYGNDPSSGITVITLTPAGRKQAEREEKGREEESVVMTRDELAAELRRLGLNDEQIALNPELRGDRFYFWPSIPAWSAGA
jgi:hypothetical protein